MSVTVRDVLDAIEDAFPPEHAEEWDAVGLLVGDPAATVSGVLVTLDPTPDALDRARTSGANVLVTHHPAFLTPPATITPPAGVAYAAARAGIALIAAHTNLDRDPHAASSLLRILGLAPGEPLEDSLLDVATVTVHVPAEAQDAVAAAMECAGAGRIGEYHACSFSAPGTGRFTPTEAAEPTVGVGGERSSVAEMRLEMVAPRTCAAAVVAAARAAHPYEEPLISVTDTSIARGAARMGRAASLQAPLSLGEFAESVATAFGIRPRVWGDREREVSVVATATGSGGGLIGAARRAGADVLLSGEVRYHDALKACESGLAVVEIGHDVSEWPLVEVLASAVYRTKDIDPASVIVESGSAGWWTP